jgi:hypothetical protein
MEISTIEFISEDWYGLKCVVNGKKINVSIEFGENGVNTMLAGIENWEEPNEYDELTNEDRKKILQAVYDYYVTGKIYPKEIMRFNFSYMTCENIFGGLKWLSYPKEDYKFKDINFDNKNILPCIKLYNELSREDKIKFHNLLLEDEKIIEGTTEKKGEGKAIYVYRNYKASRVLKDFAIRKIEECKEKPMQNPFTFGLYALDMTLTEENKEEIQGILKEYVKVAKEKNLSFEEFMSKDRPLNKIIKELP